MSESTLPTDLTPVGMLAWPVKGLADLVAETDEFQSRTGAANQTDAYRFIHYPGLAETADINTIERPAAIVNLGDKLDLSRVDAEHLRPEIDLVLTITDWCRHEQREDYCFIDFLNFVGVLLPEIAELQGVDDRLAIKAMSWKETPGRTDPKQAAIKRHYWLCQVNVQVSKL